MKKIFFITIGIVFLFFLVGLFSKPKNFEIKTPSQKNSFSTSTLISKTNSTTSLSDFFSKFSVGVQPPPEILKISSLEKELNAEIDKEVLDLTKNMIPDDNKTLKDYRQEVLKIQEKINLNNLQSPSPELFFNIAKELASINPPSLVYSTHLQLIKIYYSFGLALQKFQQTNDPLEKIMLYNFIKMNLEKLGIK